MISTILATKDCFQKTSGQALSNQNRAILSLIEIVALAVITLAAIYLTQFQWDLGKDALEISLAVGGGAILIDLTLFLFASLFPRFDSVQSEMSEAEQSSSSSGVALHVSYQCEKEAIEVDNKRFHIHGRLKNKLDLEWKKQKVSVPLNSWIEQKANSSPQFKQQLLQGRLRLFTEREREQTVLSFQDGCPMQIGLDSEELDPIKIPSGVYIYVLKHGRVYLAKKNRNGVGKGRVHHSSFFGWKSLQAAGMMRIGENGKITHVDLHSGHFQPKELKSIRKVLRKELPIEDFKRINFYRGWKAW